VRRGARPVGVTHLQVRSSSFHPLLHLSTRTGPLAGACRGLLHELLRQDTSAWHARAATSSVCMPARSPWRACSPFRHVQNTLRRCSGEGAVGRGWQNAGRAGTWGWKVTVEAPPSACCGSSGLVPAL